MFSEGVEVMGLLQLGMVNDGDHLVGEGLLVGHELQRGNFGDVEMMTRLMDDNAEVSHVP